MNPVVLTGIALVSGAIFVFSLLWDFSTRAELSNNAVLDVQLHACWVFMKSEGFFFSRM
jgi:hypothetical protein